MPDADQCAVCGAWDGEAGRHDVTSGAWVDIVTMMGWWGFAFTTTLPGYIEQFGDSDEPQPAVVRFGVCTVCAAKGDRHAGEGAAGLDRA